MKKKFMTKKIYVPERHEKIWKKNDSSYRFDEKKSLWLRIYAPERHEKILRKK